MAVDAGKIALRRKADAKVADRAVIRVFQDHRIIRKNFFNNLFRFIVKLFSFTCFDPAARNTGLNFGMWR